ncbi:MAG: GGDEF domain-containing protein [Sideroxydans sp.]|jgi:diguanylate cyclase (GGDEF)-like protein
MRRAWESVIAWLNWGAALQPNYSLRRKTLHTNLVVLAGLLGMFLCDVSFLWLGYSYDMTPMLAIVVTHLPLYLFFFISTWLNRHGRFSAARVLLMLTALTSVFIPIYMVAGDHLKFHYFFLLFAAAPMVMYSLRQWMFSMSLSLACVTLFFIVQLGGVEHDPALHLIDQDVVQFLRISYVSVMCVTLLIFAWVIERTATQNEHTLQLLAVTDPLTGLPNRRFFDMSFRQEVAKGARNEHPLVLAIVDIDHFKRINDTFGHEVGDEVLKRIAQKLSESTRAGSVTARIGGEEFAILFPRVALAEAFEVADRLRRVIEETRFQHADTFINMTISIGLAEVVADVEQAIKAADEALYLAKSAGRNRVEYHHA